MARIHAISGAFPVAVERGWQLAVDDSCGWKTPDQADAAGDWLPATVPGTVAQALEKEWKFDRSAPHPLHGSDVWYRVPLTGEGAFTLRFEGLATLAEIWLDGVVIGASESMFAPCQLDVHLSGKSLLYIHFFAMTPDSAPKASRRQRWRPNLIADPHMRQTRATLLGHMPGWCPPVDCVGPWRPVTLTAKAGVAARAARMRTWLDGDIGHLETSIEIRGIAEIPQLMCGGLSAPMTRQADGRYHAEITLPDVAKWWPHTHGDPALHPVEICAGETVISLGKVGFRTISVDRGADGDGFALRVNGVRVFCRGANWTNPDLVGLPCTRAAYLPLLTLARDAGMNMLRVSGVMAYESAEFTELLEELGILYWQDLMFANFDYDFGDVRFMTSVDAEIEALLDRNEASPALAVVCGGSEIAQQAAMLSLPKAVWSIPFFEQTLPARIADRRPDLVVVPHSPWGGDLPFAANAGVSHYYGVGAYKRPLEDARRADVRFASECLAFANLPQPEAMPDGLDPRAPEWKARAVRDLGADWDFEDTRDHYMALLYGVEPQALRREDPARYVALSMATPGLVMEATFAEWRRAGSGTGGGLVWFLSDLGPGFGWGVIDHQGRPKPAYYALKRAFRPVTVVMTDEGVNGLHLHVINDGPEARSLTVLLAAIGEDGATVIDGARTVEAAPRSAMRLTSADLFGVFFDVTHAYRFGPPAHQASVARLVDAASGDTLAEAVHFPHGRGNARADCGLVALAEQDAAGWSVVVACQRLAQSVHIACPGFKPEDDWFDLAPGAARRVRLKPVDKAAAGPAPSGRITALNQESAVAF